MSAQEVEQGLFVRGFEPPLRLSDFKLVAFDFFGWPFGVWAAAQGALLVFCAIVWVYALAMDRLDAEHGRPAGD